MRAKIQNQKQNMKNNKPKNFRVPRKLLHINMYVFVQLKRALKMQTSTSICSALISKRKEKKIKQEKRSKTRQTGQFMFAALRIRHVRRRGVQHMRMQQQASDGRPLECVLKAIKLIKIKKKEKKREKKGKFN